MTMGSNIAVRTGHLVTGEVVEYRTHNTVCEGWHEMLIRIVDPEDSFFHGDIDFQLALGDDDSSAPSYSDTEINNEIGRLEITDFVNQGTSLYTSTFLDSTQMNPSSGAFQSIVELGVIAFAGEENTEFLCNHSTIPEIQKTENLVSTIEATLELNNDTNDA